MPSQPAVLAEAADALWDAARTGNYTQPLRVTYPGLDAADAYAIQRMNTERRLAEGRRVVGCKIGLTARAVQAQLGVDQPDFGVLFDDMGFGDARADAHAAARSSRRSRPRWPSCSAATSTWATPATRT